MASIAGFTVASVLCGMSNSLAQIVAARLLQGVFGAALVPLAQVVLLDINPREKQGQAMAVWGMGVMVGPILGPTLGGWLTDSYNWRWVFFINVPIGAIALYGMWRYMRPDPGARGHAFRFVWIRDLESSDRCAAIAARSRSTERLVFLHGVPGSKPSSLVVTATYFVAHTSDRRRRRSPSSITGCSRIRISSPACCSSSSWAWCCMPRAR